MSTASLTETDVRVRGAGAVDNGHVTLTGKVDRLWRQGDSYGSVGTWLQRQSAERATADAPGIAHVDNRLVVNPPSLDEMTDEI